MNYRYRIYPNITQEQSQIINAAIPQTPIVRKTENTNRTLLKDSMRLVAISPFLNHTNY